MKDGINYVIGGEDFLPGCTKTKALAPCSDTVIGFLNALSRALLNSAEAKAYPDVTTLGFWCRRAHIMQLRKSYDDLSARLGRGVVFHIAPSNVAVNFAYSFVAGLLAGNVNIVRLPSKDFAQAGIICDAIKTAVLEYPDMAEYICFIRYPHNPEITNFLSSVCDVRVIWGGDDTISEIRKSPLKPRATELAFANRHSICLIDADEYLKLDSKRVAEDFYNDTFLMDQNACTSPKLVCWLGEKVEGAKELFWGALEGLCADRYELQPVQVVDKLTRLCVSAADGIELNKAPCKSNYVFRLEVSAISESILDACGNSGYFFEYTASEAGEIFGICGEKVQTISCVGIEPEALRKLAFIHCPRGVDRIVPVGRTLDFSLVWDGYDLVRHMSRAIG